MSATRIIIILVVPLFCEIWSVPTPSFEDYPYYPTEDVAEQNNVDPDLVPGFRVLGGKDAKRGEFPHQVYISLQRNKKDYMCSASIIHPWLLLTAAHCVLDLTPDDIEVVTGEYDLSKIDGTEQHPGVASIIIHQEYNKSNNMNDIAILVLQSTIEVNDFTKIIQIPKLDQALPGSAIISGWGLTENGRTSNILKRAEIKILSIKVCRKVFDRQVVTNDMICAGTESGRKDACKGDSGGPLTCDTTEGQKYLCGISSWGSPCEDKYKSPGVYTDVRKYYDWIHNHTIAQSSKERQSPRAKSHLDRILCLFRSC